MSGTGQGLRAVARVVVQNEAEEILLCRSRNGRSWVPPGGTLEEGEDLVGAAAREAMEEAGIEVTVGRMLYLQEFRPAGREEHVIEVAFLAVPRADRPAAGLVGSRSVIPAGDGERPWRAWYIQDPHGPRRECRWFSREALAALSEPVYPPFLREEFWECGCGEYLGLVRGT
ncbi:MAG: NUDIX domain-containing protein [Bacillota bacterium]